MTENTEAEEKGVALWNSALSTTLKIPHVAIDRTEFLKKELAPYVSAEQLDKVEASRPWELVSDEVLEKIAKACIRSTTIQASAKSFLAGLPGGIGLLGTIPADLAQYFFHTIRLSQKISYLYGFPNLVDEKGNISDSAVDLLSVYIGINMGVGVAGQALEVIAKQLARTAPKKIASQALTKTFFYPLIKKMAPFLGAKMTKQVFGKGVGKIIPVVGGLISGGLTYFSFKAGGEKFLKGVQAQKEVLVKSDAQKADQQNAAPQNTPAENSPAAQTTEDAEIVEESKDSAS